MWAPLKRLASLAASMLIHGVCCAVPVPSLRDPALRTPFMNSLKCSALSARQRLRKRNRSTV
ncbi:MAG: hypothetical protein JSV66_04860 [Trueperaceae bacterium]|nr:MAG: hypothetical protein JSV66_04860 [Trueperaceae bacterium]